MSIFRCVLASLYEGLSVRPSVRRSVVPSVGPSVGPSFGPSVGPSIVRPSVYFASAEMGENG